jgi:hypothetical protein
LLPYISLGKLLIEIEYQDVMNGMSTQYSSLFSGASTARSCANRSLVVTEAERSVDAQNTIATLLSQVAVELFDCVGAIWTSAMTSFGGDMVPIAVYGCPPNISKRLVNRSSGESWRGRIFEECRKPDGSIGSN